MVTVCREALAAEGPLDTRELAVRVIRAKGLDEGDKVLRQTVAFRVVQALSIAAKRGRSRATGSVRVSEFGKTAPIEARLCTVKRFLRKYLLCHLIFCETES